MKLSEETLTLIAAVVFAVPVALIVCALMGVR